MGTELKSPVPLPLLFSLSTFILVEPVHQNIVFNRSISGVLPNSDLLSNDSARSAVQCICTQTE